ncbi:regulator of G-protein signaling 3 isoform X1, partial [Clarias magur]
MSLYNGFPMVLLGTVRVPSMHFSTFYLILVTWQLRLAIAYRAGILIVDIIEATDLVGNDQGKCNCCVKVGLAPNSDAGTRKKTKTVPDCRSPLFQETLF